MRECRALVKCHKGYDHVSGVLDTLTLLLLLHIHLYEISKTHAGKACCVGVWTSENSTGNSAYVRPSISLSLTKYSPLRTTKMTTGWTYVQLAGTNKKESGPRYASRFFGSRVLACPLAKYSYPTLQLFKTNQHGSMCASELYFKSMRYIKSTCLRSLDLSSAHNLPLFSKKALPKPDHHLSMCGWDKIKSTLFLSHASELWSSRHHFYSRVSST